MAVSPSFKTFVLEQLSRAVSGIRARNMFGGVGIYSGDLFFALIAGDTLYLKVDDETREDFVALGSRPFQPYGDARETMQYYDVPAELLEEPESLRPWSEKAIAAAKRKQTRRKAKKK
jgi:DNA transformation protein